MQRSVGTCLCALLATAGLLGFLYSVAEASGTWVPNCSAPTVRHLSTSEAPSDPLVDVWYTLEQRFGHIGNPQRWVNILGNASDTDGIASLTYSLNGESPLELNIGPDGWRLAEEGDFNIEIDYSDLLAGNNEVVIVGTDSLDNTTVVTVAVEYEMGNVWPRPYSIDWSSVESIQDVAQVIDGLWTMGGGYIRPVGPSDQSYDRMVAVGDMPWLDYEVSARVVIHEFFSSAPGVGILVRWNGHGDDAYQPHYAHPFGALGWYRVMDGIARLRILGNDNYDIATDYSGRTLDLGVPYIFKMRAETESGPRSYYRFKVWEAGEPEPSEWDLSGYGNDIDVDELHGSIALVAHRSDASFGGVTITPPLRLSVEGGGTVESDPAEESHHYGDVVTLTAVADAGWCFSGWDGDLTGSLNPDIITLEDSKSVSATFTQGAYTLSVGLVGMGTVTVEPDQDLYDCGDPVSLTATPDAGWRFVDWTGDLLSVDNPALLSMNGHKTVTCTFSTHRSFFPLAAHEH
jgi:hypothetical protein